MALAPGTRLGPYEVTAQIGAGGMGEVYRATDTNLKRHVAIKVLPESVAGDPERLARFQREAEVLAQLNHPNIAQIHGLERAPSTGSGQAGQTALVMELIEGPTLADRIAQGAIPVDEALPIARQIADALEAAHEQGIIHRDLKPANIKVRADGTVKVLDFGLARALEPAGAASPGVSQSPTITTPAMTQAGMILGTAAYMSPEQAVGKPADRRSDLWALGVVLLEMLTGRQVFGGETVSHVVASVLRDTPDWTTLPADTPPSIRKLLKRCLEKDRRRRLADAADARLDIDDALTAGGAELESHSPPAPGAVTALRTIAWPLAFALVAAMVIAGYFVSRLQDGGSPTGVAPAVGAVRFGVSIPDASATWAVPSPDGQTLAIVGDRPDGRRGLWIRRLDGARTTEVPNLDSFTGSFAWSPDGTEIAASTARGTVAIKLDTGLVRSLADATFAPETWGTGDAILESSNIQFRALMIASGEIKDVAQGMALALSPFFLPDGRHFLFTGRANQGAQGLPDAVYVGSLDSPGEIRPVVKVRTTAKYSEGYLLFVRDGTLFAQPFDPEHAAVSGQPSPIVDGVYFFLPNGSARFDVGAGTIAYVTRPADEVLLWVDRTGAETGTLGTPAIYSGTPAISPDGHRVVVYQQDRRQGTGDLWLHDLERGGTTRLTNDVNSEGSLHWCPDGKSIVYGWDGNGPPDVYVLDVDSGTPQRRLYASDGVDYPIACLPGNRVLVRTSSGPAVNYRIVGLNGQAEDRASVVLRRAGGVVSPDGRWLAFASGDSGRSEVYVQPLGRQSATVQVSRGGGVSPVWAHDGRSLYYLAQRTVYQAVVHAGDTFASDPPVQLFSVDRDVTSFDVTPDGQRFLLLREPPSGFLPVQVIVNWRAKMGSTAGSPEVR